MNKSSIKKIQEQADFHAKSLVTLVRTVESKYGEEGKNALKEMWLEEICRKPWKKIGESVKNNDIQTLTKLVEEKCSGTHEFKRIMNKPNKVAYKFTKCRWADIFKKLGATDIGKWFCDSDPIYVKAFNPNIKFKRTKTLMNGDKYCDHVFYA